MKNICLVLLVILTISVSSCRKYLDKKSSIGLNTPSSLADFQAMLNNDVTWDAVVPQVGDLSCDDYSFRPGFQPPTGQSVLDRAHRWEPDTWNGLNSTDWNNPYHAIYYSNVVLEGLKNFPVTTPVEETEKQKITGHAFFIRAHMHYFLEETFGQPYKPATAGTDLGIPLRLNANLEDKIVRASVQAVYDQIIGDLQNAIDLLPLTSPSVIQPTKAAAYALLARVYLTKQDYSNALSAANSCLHNSPNRSLLDYNSSSVIKTGTNPFSPNFTHQSNPVPEILYSCRPVNYGIFRSSTSGTPANIAIDSNLYKQYSNDDWRKTVYFQTKTSAPPLNPLTYWLKGDYLASGLQRFYGLALNEVYLVRAECLARAGNTNGAINCLDSLLRKRWKTGLYVPSTPPTADIALEIILRERRKELIFRGLRWIDLRRLNQDPKFEKILTRNFWPGIQPLQPNDLRYTFLIPVREIQMSGIQQNPR